MASEKIKDIEENRKKNDEAMTKKVDLESKLQRFVRKIRKLS